ncbi:hypothetical protein ILYODFUR_010936 [Ilyodon furcidens]|uniref:Uncharacterized protein n=1 Tax=Ilyodon furcidens TaxID=33524 RepID=A0ABV0TVB1_9TELE
MPCSNSPAPPSPHSPPNQLTVQRDHDAQQLRGGAQPGWNKRPQRVKRGGTECGAFLKHLGDHVQPGKGSQQWGSGLGVVGWQQEAAIQSGCQDGGHRGVVTMEQKHTAT